MLDSGAASPTSNLGRLTHEMNSSTVMPHRDAKNSQSSSSLAGISKKVQSSGTSCRRTTDIPVSVGLHAWEIGSARAEVARAATRERSAKFPIVMITADGAEEAGQICVGLLRVSQLQLLILASINDKRFERQIVPGGVGSECMGIVRLDPSCSLNGIFHHVAHQPALLRI